MKRKINTYYNENQLPLIMTTYEVSILLRCSQEYVREIAHDGKLPYKMNGKNMVYKKSDVLSYLEQ